MIAFYVEKWSSAAKMIDRMPSNFMLGCEALPANLLKQYISTVHRRTGGDVLPSAATATMTCLPEALKDALITDLPASGYYIPNFISPQEEDELLRQVLRCSFNKNPAKLISSRLTPCRCPHGETCPIVVSKLTLHHSHQRMLSLMLLFPTGFQILSFLASHQYLLNMVAETTSSAVLHI